MKKELFGTLFVVLTAVTCVFSQAVKSNLRFVDPSIGGVGLILEPTRPTVQLWGAAVNSPPSAIDINPEIYR